MEGLFEPNRPRDALKYFEAKLSFSTSPREVDAAIRDGERIVLIDLRPHADFEEAHVPGARTLPESDWDSFAGLSKSHMNILYGRSLVCQLPAEAAVRFAAAGFPVMEMIGGFKGWLEEGLQTERGDQKLDLTEERQGYRASNPDLARNYDANTDTNVNSFAPR